MFLECVQFTVRHVASEEVRGDPERDRRRQGQDRVKPTGNVKRIHTQDRNCSFLSHPLLSISAALSCSVMSDSLRPHRL